jgi:hypothetical protein
MNVMVIAEAQELPSCEPGAVICDNGFGDPEAMDDVCEEC